MELAMDVTADCDWCGYVDDVALLDEELPCFVAYLADRVLRDDTACSELGNVSALCQQFIR